MTKKLLVGALAGAAGGVAMKVLVRFVDPHAFGLSTKTDADSARAVWQLAGLPPPAEPNAERIGAAMHYAFAVGAGCVYATAAPRFPFLRVGSGSLFGAALWLAGDEVAITLSGLEDARLTPLRSHASALAAHVLFGLVVHSLGGS